MFTKMFGRPPLANDYSYADRIMNDYNDHAVRVVKAETIVGHVPRDVTHILALHYAWWERRMRGNGKEDARRMRDNGKEDARKMGGADKQGGAHSRDQFFRCGKIGGGADKRWGAL